MRGKSIAELKAEAIAYYSNNKVLQNIEQALNLMFKANPEDQNGFLSVHFENLSKPPCYHSFVLTNSWSVCRGSLSKVEIYGSWKGKRKLLGSVVYTTSKSRCLSSMQNIQNTSNAEATDVWDFQSFLTANVHQTLKDKVIDWNVMLDMDVVSRSAYNDLTETCQKTTQPLSIDAGETAPGMMPQVADNSKKSAGTSGRRSKTKSGRSTSSTKAPVIETVPAALPAAADLSALSLCLCLASANSFNPPKPLYTFAAELNFKLREKEEASEHPNDQFGHIPLPIVTLFNGPGCGNPFTAGKCKCIHELWIIPKPDVSPAQISIHLYELKNRVVQTLMMKSNLNPQIICDNGASSIPMDRPEQGVDLAIECLEACQIRTKFFLGINLAGESMFDEIKGKYEPIKGVWKTAEELTTFYAELLSKYPEIRLLVNPFRKQDKQNWSMLQERFGPSVLLSISSIPESIEPSCAAEASEEGINTPERLRPPSGPGIRELLYGSPRNMSNSPSAAIQSVAATEQSTNEVQAEEEPRSYSAWLFNTEPRLNSCLVTELCRAIQWMKEKSVQTIFSVVWSKPDLWSVELAIGFGVSFIKFGGLFSDGAMTQLSHWLSIAAGQTAQWPPNYEERIDVEGALNQPVPYSWMSTFGAPTDTESM